MNHPNRRDFIQAIGSTAVVATAYRLSGSWLSAQSTSSTPTPGSLFHAIDFEPIPISHADDVLLPKGFSHEVLISRGARLNQRGDTFGDDNDFIAILPRGDSEGWLWVNHESTDAVFLLEAAATPDRLTREVMGQYLQSMGGSCIRISKNQKGLWRPLLPDPRNFRLTGHTPNIPFTGPAAGTSWLKGAKMAVGSVANCGGAVTPWGTIITAEENVFAVYGDPEQSDPPTLVNRFFDRPPEHYGYLVEVDPDTGEFWKHTALGRFAHENIVFATSKDGRLVGYMGDDRARQCLYKFISRDRFDPAAGKSNRRLLHDGTLYVADTIKGRWIPLDPTQQKALAAAKFDPARVCVHTRTAAMMCGGTPHGRPEGITRNTETGEVFISLSSHPHTSSNASVDPNRPSDLAGAIAKLKESGEDPGALDFSFSIHLMSGQDTGLAWPDNLSFITDQHLMICSDYKGQYPSSPKSTHGLFGNNLLTIAPLAGPNAGRVQRFASAPREAEFASPILTPDQRELWVSVQHPGEGSTSAETLISHWPQGGKAWPRSSVIAIARNT